MGTFVVVCFCVSVVCSFVFDSKSVFFLINTKHTAGLSDPLNTHTHIHILAPSSSVLLLSFSHQVMGYGFRLFCFVCISISIKHSHV